jgi:mRNA interferase RelE/StbE
MNLLTERNFIKDLKNISDKKIKLQIANIIQSLQTAQSIKEILHLKKLNGDQDYYRIRVGDYRLGIKIQDDTIILIRCLLRKDIYRYFP